ncbi:TerC family protein [Candidatus Methylocalor cossyra]|uniref:Uncharacterized membrane protein YjbE n=1 Tax=Candidatus Methylocalor cossyra TaxID=3108543 RepID=A0ABM9NF70_9GAMM
MPGQLADSHFLIGLGQIIVVNIILSGDNAVVIALAARSLPDDQRRQAVVWGSTAAVVLRIVLTLVAAQLLKLSYLKILGGLVLGWLAVQFLVPEERNGTGIEDHDDLLAAIRTILLADLVMSLDNVIAVAAAAKGNLGLLVGGLAISIPLVIFGSALILRVMDRIPLMATLAAALLGYVAGEMFIGDPALGAWSQAQGPWLSEGVPLAAALSVVLAGKWLAKRKAALAPPRAVDLAAEDQPPKADKFD